MMPQGRRIALTVYVNLDPVPGTFHTEESARETVQRILDQTVPSYFPGVSLYSPSRHVAEPKEPTGTLLNKKELLGRDETYNKLKHREPLLPLGDWKLRSPCPGSDLEDHLEKFEKPETD
jgi:hypothetical protein